MTQSLNQQICWQLPDWVDDLVATWTGQFDTEGGRMRLAIAVADTNVKAGTGGPFGAAVFSANKELVAVGMNLVTSTRNSCAHAEVVALSLAQQSIGEFDLAAAGRYELVTSTDPCAMCLGAIPWSGVVRLVCGANGADAEAVGFDEGAKPADWIGSLAARGIETVTGVEREAAAAVLQAYQRGGGEIYNSSRN
jgi:tRNA(Arg) A34 adenosine deaminase TadA